MVRFLLSTIALLVAAGCGASDVEVRSAKTSAYKADFAVVYSEALAAVRDLYPTLNENPVAGTIKTAWHPINLQQGTEDEQQYSQAQNAGGRGASAFQQTTALRKHYFVRFDVHVVGGNPWQVRVHGRAASWKAGEIPTPLSGAEVPPWLEGRTNALEVAIYRRLKKYAVKMKTRARVAKAERPAPDASKFTGVPEAAAKVLAEVETAARTRDSVRLRSSMADEFTYSLGDAPSADTAVVIWQADPAVLTELAGILSQGCVPKDDQIVCPAAFRDDPDYLGYRAGFAQVDGAWKMIFFVKGD